VSEQDTASRRARQAITSGYWHRPPAAIVVMTDSVSIVNEPRGCLKSYSRMQERWMSYFH
jgi:hypothetical protein